MSGRIGATFELPFDSTRRESERAAALLSASSSRERREARQQQIGAEVNILLDRIETALELERLAQQTVELAGQLVEAQEGRFTSLI